MTTKIVNIVGARPQFVKAAVVSQAMRSRAGFASVLVHTGQHYDQNMSEVFFSELEIPPADYTLGIGSGSHGMQTGRMLEAIEKLLIDNRPDWVVVYGDTNSTLAGGLAAAKLHVPVAHVEAGLRSFNRKMPEETNRVLVDHVSDLLLAPTEVAVGHLRREGLPESRIHLVGDVMYDAALFYASLAANKSDVLGRIGVEPGKYILATVHRAENTNDPERLRTIVEALAGIATEIPVVWPVHPRTRQALTKFDRPPEVAKGILAIDPVGYLDMARLEQNALVVATDSGGVQKEAFFFEVPCVTLRSETEWTELVELGWNQVVPPLSTVEVRQAILRSIGRRGAPGQPYGDGHAAQRIVSLLESV